MGQATTPAVVPTADSPRHSPRHAEAEQAETGRYSVWDASYNYGLKDTPLAVGHQPWKPCPREVRAETGHATTPAGVETADGTAARQDQTSRHNHHGVCCRPKATAAWCSQGTAHCNERKPDGTVTVIHGPVICAPPAHVWDCQQQAEPPTPPKDNTPPYGRGTALE